MDELLSGLDSSATVLDLGCGKGSFDYGNYPFHIKAVDQHQPPETVRFPDNVEFRKCLSDELPFPDGSFDLVIANFVFEHFSHPARALR